MDDDVQSSSIGEVEDVVTKIYPLATNRCNCACYAFEALDLLSRFHNL